MLTKNDIVNLALGKLGQTLFVTNVDTETSNVAKVCKRYWPMSLSSVLSKHPWSIFTKQAPLSLVTTNPSAKWAYAYALPADAHVIRRLALDTLFSDRFEYLDQMFPFEAVNSASGYEIHTNVPDAHAEYTCKIPDGSLYVDHFGRAVAAQLAMDIAPSLITNNYIKMKKELLADAKADISEQIADDITLAVSPRDAESPFIRARRRF